MDSQKIIQAWKDFIFARDLEQIKLPAKNIVQSQKIQFSGSLEKKDDQYFFHLPTRCQQHIFEHYCDKKKHKLKTETAYLLFPLIQIEEPQANGYKTSMLYPLFLFEVTDDVFIDASQLKFPIQDSGQVVPLSKSFKKILGVDNIEDFGSAVCFVDLISQLTGNQYSAFDDVWAGLLDFINDNLRGSYQRVIAFDGIITEFNNAQDFNKFIKLEFDHYARKKIPEKYPLLHHYLQKEAVLHETVESPIYGLFEKQYPLGSGQLSVVRDVQLGKPLIGVQGAPGTGKTTLFKSIIANQVVQKALSIISGDDKNYGMLIVSTANTAVDGVIDDFKKDDALKGIDWLYFRGGNHDRFCQEVTKVDSLINTLRSSKVDLANLAGLKKKILLKKASIDDDFKCYQQAYKELSLLDKWFSVQGIETFFELKSVQPFAKQLVEKGFWGIKAQCLWRLSWSFKKDVVKFYDENTAQLQYFNIESIDFRLLEVWHALAIFTQLSNEIVNKDILLQLLENTSHSTKPSSKEKLCAIFINPKNKLHLWSGQFFYFVQKYPDGHFLSYQRTQHIAINRELFDLSISYLYEYILSLGDELADALTVWSDTVTGKNGDAYLKYAGHYDNFHNLITLAYPVMASTLVSAYKQAIKKYKILESHKPFNLCLCDEAGMIAAHDMVPVLARSHRAVIVGDPLQLEPIGNLSYFRQEELRQTYFSDADAEYLRLSPELVTAFHRASGCASGSFSEIGDSTVLEEHRRCQKPIAELFITLAGYRGVKVETLPPTKRIQKAFDNFGSYHLMFYSVEGKKGTLTNTNLDEVGAIGEVINQLEKAGYDPKSDIGVITPYSNQSKLLRDKYGERLNHTLSNEKIGTVHKFQGAQFEVILFSPVVHSSRGAINFINKKPNLLNVAVSRAKQQFIVIGNYYQLVQAKGYLKTLAEAVGNSFLSVHEKPGPEAIQAYKKGAVRLLRDCEHISYYESLCLEAKQSLTIVSPWIFSKSSDWPHKYQPLKDAVERGVEVKVYYGWKNIKHGTEDDGDNQLIQQLKQLLGRNLIRLKSGTHEKIIIQDRRVLVVGSWNWLSHSYFKVCQLDMTQNRNFLVRRETSAVIDDSVEVQKLISNI